jgi:hypothetical protein
MSVFAQTFISPSCGVLDTTKGAVVSGAPGWFPLSVHPVKINATAETAGRMTWIMFDFSIVSPFSVSDRKIVRLYFLSQLTQICQL